MIIKLMDILINTETGECGTVLSIRNGFYQVLTRSGERLWYETQVKRGGFKYD
mgnify:CR=1 FL=1